MRKFQFFRHISLAVLMGLIACSCSDDDDTNSTPTPSPSPTTKVSYVITAGNAASDLQGGNSLLIINDLSNPTDTTVYNNPAALFTKDTFTQVSYNGESKIFNGYIYGRGAVELGGAGIRSYEIVDNKLQVIGEPVMLSNFGNTGTYGAYSYAAAISSASVMQLSRNGNTITGTDILVDLAKYEIDGTTPSITGVVDRGNNQLIIALNYVNRDSAVVAFTDYNFNISSVQYDARIGASVGAWRSVRYTQIGIDDDGNTYVFSGTGKSAVGALKINKGTSIFDSNYFFDVLSASDGYRFRKVFHISSDYFLLEFYNEKDKYGNMDSSSKFAVVKMSDRTLKWVTGLPTPENISSVAWPEGNDGTIYLPINPTIGKPTIYAINAKTAESTICLTIGETELLKSITVIKQ